MARRRELTVLELGRIIHGTQAGVDYRTLADELGRRPSVVHRILCRYGIKPVLRGNRGREPWKDYTVYDAKSEAVMAMGTAKECANTLGIKQTTFYEYISRQRHGGYAQPVVIVEEGSL